MLVGALCARASAQSLTLFDIDTRSYPLLRAQFHAFDATGAHLETLQPGDFLLTENGIPRSVVDVSCPPATGPRDISAVLTMDVSGSMDAGRLSMAQEAAHAWIDAFPAGASECALTAFTTVNALLQDFTNDRDLLHAAVDRLRAGGGTSFDAALVDPFAGALTVAQRGRHHRVIVLLTDGRARGNDAAILSAASRAGASVYAVTIGEDTPELLRRLCEATGGRSFSQVMTRQEVLDIYRSILQLATQEEPCVITWESGGCSYARQVKAELPAYGCAGSGSYSVTRQDLQVLGFSPSAVLRFDPVSPGSSGEKLLTLRAEGRSVEIRSVTPDDQRFSVVDFGGTAPPFVIPAGQQRVLRVRYDALDSSFASCRFALETTACEDAFFATAGYPGKGEDGRVITLLHPNGGEVFVAGSDTVITWSGVTPADEVRLDFSADDGTTWVPVAARTSGLAYPWRVPMLESDRCLVRVTLLASLPAPDDMVLVPPGSFRMGDQMGTGSTAERPVHDVTLTQSFYMSRTEITQRAWVDVMQFNPSPVAGDQLPVLGVSWKEAVEYCNARSVAEGLQSCYSFEGDSVRCDWSADGYRLPTEAEWEYACRAGSADDYCTGGMRDPYCDGPDQHLHPVGWYCGNAGGALQEVGLKQSNAFGLHDMHGNAPEWCWDYLNAYASGQQVDPLGPPTASPARFRVYRGGGYGRFATECRSAARNGTHEATVQGIGFRVVRSFR